MITKYIEYLTKRGFLVKFYYNYPIQSRVVEAYPITHPDKEIEFYEIRRESATDSFQTLLKLVVEDVSKKYPSLSPQD